MMSAFVISLVLAGHAVTATGAPVSAGPLAAAHAGLACEACHRQGRTAVGVSCSSAQCHPGIQRSFRASKHDRVHLAGGIRCVACHGGHPVRTGAAAAAAASGGSAETRCLSCHAAERFIQGPGFKPPVLAATPEHNIHAAARRRETCAAASVSCFTCHGIHGTAPIESPDSPVCRARVATTCGSCHAPEREAYLASVHGRGVRMGMESAPTCVSCHGAHGVQGARASQARTAPEHVVYSCAGCHEDPKVTHATGLSGDVVIGYETSVHGLAYQCGIHDVATCVSCHGSHRVVAPDDPSSPVNPTHIRETCRHCHGAVTGRMIQRIDHVSRQGGGNPIHGLKIYLPVAGTAINPLLASGIGTLVGFLSGIFGVGGGFLMTPLLIFIGIPAAVAAATDSAQITAGASSGALSHARLGNVDFRMGLAMAAGSLPGGFLGVDLVHLLRGMGDFDFILKLLYVLLLAFTGGTMLVEGFRALSRRPGGHAPGGPRKVGWMHRLPFRMDFPASGLEISVAVPILAGVSVGILAAFLGVGGGFILMPMMIYMIGIPTRVAVGTGLFQIMLTCAYVTVAQAVSNHTVDVVLAMALFIGSTIGAQLGVLISRRLRGEQIRLLLGIIVLVVMGALVYQLAAHPALLIQFAHSGGGS